MICAHDAQLTFGQTRNGQPNPQLASKGSRRLLVVEWSVDSCEALVMSLRGRLAIEHGGEFVLFFSPRKS